MSTNVLVEFFFTLKLISFLKFSLLSSKLVLSSFSCLVTPINIFSFFSNRYVILRFKLDFNMKQNNQCFSILNDHVKNQYLWFCCISKDFHWQITEYDDRRTIPNQNHAKITGNNCNLSIKSLWISTATKAWCLY